MPKLRLLKGKAPWREYRLDSELEVIGRDAEHSTVLLEDHVVSRRHAEIVRDGDRFYILDFGKSGTTLNNRRLVKSKRYLLTSNDLIQICDYVLTFLDDSKDRASTDDSVYLDDSNSSSFSHVLDLSSGSWRRRIAIRPAAQLSAIIELTHDLRKCKSLDELLSTALDSLLKLFKEAYRGVVVLTEAKTLPSVTRVVRYRDGENEQTAIISTGLVEGIMTSQEAGLSDSELMMCAPLIDGDGEPLGVLILDSREGQFNPDDLELFATVVTQLAIAIENRILHEVALLATEMQLELKVANEVQIGLLPGDRPQIKSYEFFDYYSPAKKVGGDYYDYIEGDDQHLAIVLGDVAGKGIPAALFMAKIASELSLFLASGLDPVSVLQRLNSRVDQRNPRGTFVTMVLAILDYTTDEIVLVNAGHMSPLLCTVNGAVKEIGRKYSGLPLGVDPSTRYAESRLTIRPGETIVFYSDGVTDAQNIAEERYGAARLRSVLTQQIGNATSVGERIMNDIHEFVGDAQQFDDICLLCISRQADP